MPQWFSAPALRVMTVLLQTKGPGLSGSEISRDADIANGTAYALLLRWEEFGWLTSDFEKRPGHGKGPRRRLYKATAAGRAAFREEIMPLQLSA